jgi:hypothetical protein
MGISGDHQGPYVTVDPEAEEDIRMHFVGRVYKYFHASLIFT